jgi:hypothetical protein
MLQKSSLNICSIWFCTLIYQYTVCSEFDWFCRSVWRPGFLVLPHWS